MPNKSKQLIIWGIVTVVIITGIGIYFGYTKSVADATPGKYDVFAQCLKDKGATFYGAFWCPHCQNQKAMFGKSEKLLPYVECSTPDARSQLAVCQDKKITGYPTWEFADGSRETGEVPLERLAEKTGCKLPQ